LKEYYGSMKKGTAEIKDSRIRQAFNLALETVREEIETTEATSWSGIYLI
jgi:hypothetical protein